MTPASPPPDPPRWAAAQTCPRCNAEVPAERHESDDCVTWIWRCTCGWARARTQSGVVTRSRARDAIAKAKKDDDEGG